MPTAKRNVCRAFGALVIGLGCCASVAGQVVLETRDVRLEVGADGLVRSLRAKASGTEYAWTAEPGPVAAVYRGGDLTVASQVEYAENEPPGYRGGQVFPATAASLAGDRLTLRFEGAGCSATYRVTMRPEYLAFELVSLEGPSVDRIDLVRLRIRRLPHLGPWIDVAYDDQFGVCLCGGNLQTNAGLVAREKYIEMLAVAERRVALEGTVAVLFGCNDPRRRFLDRMEVVERDCHMPAGARNRRSPFQNYSYLWCSPTPQDVDEYIRLAKRAGFRVILYSYTAFSRGAGHFLWNDRYPNGMADLKKVADAIRAAGLHVGLHIHYTKALRTDPYLTPVPDERFHKLRRFTLAEAIDAQTTTIPLRENPAGAMRDKDRRLLKIGRELVTYEDYTTEPPYRFVGCQRGHGKTQASGHAGGQTVELLDVDDWSIFVRFDQDTDIQDEVARRIAEIVRQTGPYVMLYFDGAEDVHDPFWYHVARAQYRVYRLLEPEIPVCEGAMSSHYSWHILTRGNAFDLPTAEHIKAFCYHISCRTAPIRVAEFSHINFGWIFHFFPTMGPDVLEYVLSRGAAWDCPFSLRVTLHEVAAHPRADDCLDVIRLWEETRIHNRLSPQQKEALKTLPASQYQLVKTWPAIFSPEWVDRWRNQPFADQEHHLFVDEQGRLQLVPIAQVADVAGKGVKAWTFRRPDRPDTTYVLAWAERGQGEWRVPVPAGGWRAMRPFGKPLDVRAEGHRLCVPLAGRTYLELPGLTEAQAHSLVAKSQWHPQ